jgi:hypothetical protein
VVCKPQSSGLLNGNRKPLLFRYALRFTRLQIRSLDRYDVMLASLMALSLCQWGEANGRSQRAVLPLIESAGLIGCEYPL